MNISIYKLFTILILCFLQLVCAFGQATKSPTENIRRTNWEVLPSLKLDTLCFVGILTGDPFYLRFYKTEYNKFAPRINPEVREALDDLKRKIKDENKSIISANLTLYFSATDDKNIADMLRTLKNTKKMQATLKKSSFYNEQDWQVFETVKKDLQIVLKFLKDTNFERYWTQNYLPSINRKIAETKPDLPKYNVVKEVENLTGYKFSSNTITVFILHFPNPHGIRVTGLRFIMSDDTSFKGTIFIATHELIHEPVRTIVSDDGDQNPDVEIKAALDALRADEFLTDKVKNHNPSLGYNSFEGLLNEDITQTLDQIIGEKLGTEREERHKRWKNFDEGIHVFAPVLYTLIKEENFENKGETLREFLLRMFRSGKLSAGKIKPIYDRFYNEIEAK